MADLPSGFFGWLGNLGGLLGGVGSFFESDRPKTIRLTPEGVLVSNPVLAELLA